MRWALRAIACLILSASVSAQEFDVVSIKLDPVSRPPVNVIDKTFMKASATAARNGRYAQRATTLGTLIEAAYGVRDFQVLGAPSWVNSERYDLDARAPGAMTFDEMRPLLQNLLADRFKLALRRETRQMPVYELVPVDSGLTIVPMKEGSCVPIEKAKPFEPLNICGGLRRQIVSPAPARRDAIEAVGVPMATLIEYLSEETGRTVIDKTAFTEVFNFRLEFASIVDAGLASVDTPASGLSIFTALEEQLGLRLRSTTGPVDVLVIDRVERPSPN
ncbi:MAG TPA: TIGR03435 family protein [Vicinamibacterales bacterium]